MHLFCCFVWLLPFIYEIIYGDHCIFARSQIAKERKPEDRVYYNARNSIPVAVVSPTVTTQHIEEEEEPRYVTTDDVTTHESNHDYSEAIFTNPPTHDVYAIPNRSRNMRQDSDNDVTVVDNEVYTEDHGFINHSTGDNDVTLLDNAIYTDDQGEMADSPSNDDVTVVDNDIYTETHGVLPDAQTVYYNTRSEVIDTLENPYGDDKEDVSDWLANSNR